MTIRAVVLGTGSPVALEELIQTLPERCGFALVAFCHGDASLTERLRAVSRLPVVPARGRVKLEPDRVYVVPADCDGAFQRSELVVLPGREPRAPIDRLLRSLADEIGAQGAGVILDGRGSDGVIGIKRVKEAGGLALVQAPNDASGNDGEMPRAVIATGMADLVLSLSEIGARLAALARQNTAPAGATDEDTEPRSDEAVADTLRDILTLVRLRTGHDFSSYKRATLYRRVSRRMQVCQCESITAYHAHLRDHPAELGHLLRDFLISVTNFFRDRSAFDALETEVIPRLFLDKSPGEQIRVWVTGCATGEEAYSIGMLLCDHAARLNSAPQLQIFATDIDEEALAEARLGRYPNTIAADLSPEQLRRFFTQDGDHYRVGKELREIVLFSPHNLLRDPPFSRLDLISCRNLLIYLNRDAQDRVLTVFHFGLRPDGCLFLGSSEAADNTSLFTTFDAKHRLFLRQPASMRLTSDSMALANRWQPPVPAPAPARAVAPATPGELHHRVIERYAPPSVLVNEDLDIVHVSERAGALLQVAGGEPSRQVLRLIHPALRIELRTALYAARQPGGGTHTRVVRFTDQDKPRAVELRVRRVEQAELGRGSLLIMFDELEPAPGSAHDDGASATLEPMMRALEDELHRTRDQLRTTIEQYETSLEELKASNEELQAINEELRSATEELETSKEELQSVNEELTTLNHELNLKIEEVSHANNDLQNLMTSTDIGVIFLDRALNIKRFTPRAQDLYNVIPTDIGRPLAHLTHRLETEDVPQLARSVLHSLRGVERDVRSRDGRRYLARLLPYRSLEDRIDGVVVTFVEVSDLRDAVDARTRSEAALETTAARLSFALRTAPMLVVSLDAQLRPTWGYVLGSEFDDPAAFTHLLFPGHADQFTACAQRVLRGAGTQRAELDLVIQGERRTYDLRFERTPGGVDVVGFDITPGKLAEASLIAADRRKDEFLATLSHELRNPLTPLKVALDIARLAEGDRARLDQSRGIMERQVAQLSQLVDELLDLSRITQGKIEIEHAPLDPATIVEAALEATRPLIQQRGHRLSVVMPKIPGHVLGDKLRLTQVLTNLLNNAVKYTPTGGHIELQVDADLPRDVLRIRVRDDGEGIAADLMPRIFELFVQGSDVPGRASSGLGIGLNLVKRLVGLHAGRVSASSRGPGRGSDFIVELPLVRGQA